MVFLLNNSKSMRGRKGLDRQCKITWKARKYTIPVQELICWLVGMHLSLYCLAGPGWAFCVLQKQEHHRHFDSQRWLLFLRACDCMACLSVLSILKTCAWAVCAKGQLWPFSNTVCFLLLPGLRAYDITFNFFAGGIMYPSMPLLQERILSMKWWGFLLRTSVWQHPMAEWHSFWKSNPMEWKMQILHYNGFPMEANDRLKKTDICNKGFLKWMHIKLCIHCNVKF